MERIVVPESYYTCDTAYLVQMIADMLCTLMTHNDQIPVTHTNLTRFHSRAAPGISIADYLRRIIKYASVERACLLAILLYIDRVCERHRSFTISSLTVHRFIIAAVTVSAKAICDSYCTNAHYAKVGGISTQELNTLELEFLFLINWQVASPASVLQQYYVNLVRQYPAYSRSLTPAPIPPGTVPDTAPRRAMMLQQTVVNPVSTATVPTLPLVPTDNTTSTSSVGQSASSTSSNLGTLVTTDEFSSTGSGSAAPAATPPGASDHQHHPPPLAASSSSSTCSVPLPNLTSSGSARSTAAPNTATTTFSTSSARDAPPLPQAPPSSSSSPHPVSAPHTPVQQPTFA
ncbi:cyclin-domain-containing protein [Catenaria anguillulae PL171]|uniref:Cyclin-domain-containing protein n=1 Tax=Catenaria anguillulae PL171 TaxID=765915 RepID=A0A1Y2HJM9_9FUNG|nr:cyclin-domain-containing protein [Catenaria anguillulae PL171]